ncbi:hypothetical protein ABZY36_31735 [Streptomyces sp. NPDC006627]|uniref:hypothetical protein n=1 Tax=Streptomyces sp. NPDC006627 TaxID=3154679 RepID=UPI0033AB2DA5
MSRRPDEETLLVSTHTVSIARPHGLACWNCGVVARSPAACGHVHDEDGSMRLKRLRDGMIKPQHAVEASG